MPEAWTGDPPPRYKAPKRWDELLAGDAWVFTEDIDFHTTVDNFRSQTYQMARRRGLQGHITLYQIEPDDQGRRRLFLQAHPPDDYVRPPVPIRPPSKEKKIRSKAATKGLPDGFGEGPVDIAALIKERKRRTGA